MLRNPVPCELIGLQPSGRTTRHILTSSLGIHSPSENPFISKHCPTRIRLQIYLLVLLITLPSISCSPHPGKPHISSSRLHLNNRPHILIQAPPHHKLLFNNHNKQHSRAHMKDICTRMTMLLWSRSNILPGTPCPTPMINYIQLLAEARIIRLILRQNLLAGDDAVPFDLADWSLLADLGSSRKQSFVTYTPAMRAPCTLPCFHRRGKPNAMPLFYSSCSIFHHPYPDILRPSFILYLQSWQIIHKLIHLCSYDL